MDNHRSKAHAARPTLPPAPGGNPGFGGQGGHGHGAPKHGGHGGQMGHHHGGPSKGALPPAPGGAAGYSRNPPPQPTKQLTPKETDEIVKRTKSKLFEKLQPLLKGDQTDFTVDSHNGRVEFCFPCNRPGAVMKLVRSVCDYATHESTAGAPASEVCVAMLREKFMVVRIREQSAPRFGAVYRLEVMLPIEGVGQGLVMAVAQSLKPEDINLCEQLYKFAGGHSGGGDGAEGTEGGEGSADEVQEAVEKLRGLGVDVWVPKDQMDQEEGKVRKPSPEAEEMWAGIAGYEKVKTQVKQSITLPLLRPDVFARMSAITRGGSGSGKNTSGVLFTGPPGVGKTSMAKVASHVACTPLVYVPVESIVSKWYGEAEQKLRSVFEATRKLGSAVLFLDELDAFAGSRDSNMHEVTRRILCVLLRQLDGLESDTKEGEEKKLTRVVLVGATNRPTDLDAALRSRFNKMVDFPLPDAETRAAIFATYATTLQADELERLGERSEGFAGRDIRECCDDAEHRFVAHLLDNEGGYEMQAEDLRPPGVEDYLAAIDSRKIDPENGC